MLALAASDASDGKLVRKGRVQLVMDLQGLPLNDQCRTGTHFVRQDNNASVILFFRNLYADPNANSIAYQMKAIAVVRKERDGKVFWKYVTEPRPSTESPTSYKRLKSWIKVAVSKAVVNTGGKCYGKAYGRREPPLDAMEIMSVDPDTGLMSTAGLGAFLR